MMERVRRKRPITLLNEPSPYGSCHLVVESDPTVTAAYLLDEASGVRTSLWLANHVPAPHTLDRQRIDAGLLPPMPAGHTKHEEGRERLRRRSLGTVWFEEGDGVTITEDGAPLGVLPGWPGGAHTAPGYSRDAIGRTPLGWALEEADGSLLPRVAAARELWRRHADRDGWGRYQRAVLGHLEQRLGQGARYWSVDGNRLPRVGMVEHPDSSGRCFTVTCTVGMSCQRMPEAGRHDDSPGRRIELALATNRPYEATVDLFTWLARYPWQHRSLFEPGHVAEWDAGAGRFPLGDRWDSALLLAEPGALLGPAVPDLSGFTAGGEAVHWLWVIPLTSTQRAIAANDGTHALVDELRLRGHQWVVRV